jgi:surface polysaccharide O-acyltransferase-like enzyme
VTDRIHSLDALKGVALLAVFFIHARGSFIENYQVNTIPGFILINTARFAVPVFFLISGYIFHVKTENHGSWSYTKKYLKNVGKYYILGSVFWLVIQAAILFVNSFLEIEMLSGYIQLKIFSLESILYFGDAVSPHLWFLTALFISIALIHLFDRINRFKTLFGLSTILHLIGILSIAYHVPVGFKVPINDALFFGLFLTSAGYYIEEKKPELKERRKLLLSSTVILIVLHLVERTALAVILNSSPPYKWSGFSFLTAPMSISIFLYALSRPELGEDSRLSEYGRETLWGYILHPAVLGLLIGLTTLIEVWTNLNLLQNVLWSIFITLTAYIGTMEFLCSSWREKLGRNMPYN